MRNYTASVFQLTAGKVEFELQQLERIVCVGAALTSTRTPTPVPAMVSHGKHSKLSLPSRGVMQGCCREHGNGLPDRRGAQGVQRGVCGQGRGAAEAAAALGEGPMQQLPQEGAQPAD